jgi:hypothetical protein
MELFLLFSNGLHAKPIEHAVNYILLTLLLAQLGTGYAALRNAAEHHAARFQELTR